MKLRVTYAKRSYKDKIYRVPLVQYSYRDEKGTPRHKTVVSLSKLPAIVVKVVEETLKRGDTSILEELIPKSQVQFRYSFNIGKIFVAFCVLLQLNIVGLLRKFLNQACSIAILAFILERIIAEKPLSVSALQRQFRESPSYYILGSPSVPHLNTWYKALGELEAVREKILLDLYTRKPATDKVFLYDITSSYFEGDKCPLSEFGYNRDGKKGKKQIVLGIICDCVGRPVWCDVYKGNTQDQTTVQQQLHNLKDKLGVKEFIFVGDRGMVTNARIEELGNDGWWDTFGYVTALKRKELFQLIDDSSHPLQPELFDHRNLVEINHNGERYVLCHNPFKRDVDRHVREKLLEKTEEKLLMISRNVKSGRLKSKDKIARRLYRWINNWNMERFFTVEYDEGFFTFERRQSEINRYSAVDGCYVIRANVSSESLSKEELQTQYKDLKHVEQAFRTMKTTNINMRPIRVWTEQHVRGYIFGCFLSYLATWEIKHRLGSVLKRGKDGSCQAGSLQEIFKNLDRISVGVLEIAGKVHTDLSRISKANKQILRLLKLPTLSKIVNQLKCS